MDENDKRKTQGGKNISLRSGSERTGYCRERVERKPTENWWGKAWKGGGAGIEDTCPSGKDGPCKGKVKQCKKKFNHRDHSEEWEERTSSMTERGNGKPQATKRFARQGDTKTSR